MATTKTQESENQNSESQSKIPKFEYIAIFDWNIVHYWLSKDMKDAIAPIIISLDKAKVRFAISEISIYEAQRQLPVKKAGDSHKLLSQFPRYAVTPEIYIEAGTLACCYEDNPKIKPHALDIALPDQINAATAMHFNTLLLTADYADYPRPFFDEVTRWTVTSKKGRDVKIYLLNPDRQAYINAASKWIEPLA